MTETGGIEDTSSFSMSDTRDTPDRYYHQLSSTGSYQSISYMGLSDDDDEDMMIVERGPSRKLQRQASYRATSAENLDTSSSYKASSEQLDEETKPYLEKLVSYKEHFLPYCPNTSDEEPEEEGETSSSCLDQWEQDELELDELESQYMLSDQFAISQYQISKTQTRLKKLKEQYEEFQDQLLEDPLSTIATKEVSVDRSSCNMATPDLDLPPMPMQIPEKLGSSEIHIDLHKAFLKECRNLDSYFNRLEEKEMTRTNIQHMSEHVNKLRDLYMAFLINHIDQKYQILSLKNTISISKATNTQNDEEKNKSNSKTSTTSTKVAAKVTQKANRENSANATESHLPQHTPHYDKLQPSQQQSPYQNTGMKSDTAPLSTDSTGPRNRRVQQQATYTRPHVLILKNTIKNSNSNSNNNKKLSFKAQKNEIEKFLQPHKYGISIKSIGPTRQGGLVLSFFTENECKIAHDILKRQPNPLQLQVTVPSIIHPKMVIHDIGNQWNVQELKSMLITENVEIGEAVQHGEMFDIVFLSKEGEVIIKVSPLIRNILKQKGRVFANQESYRISDRVFVKRCYRCHQFGHFSSACMYHVQKCGHCNGNHMLKDCIHKDDATKAVCINCSKSKLYKNKANHRPSDPQCPSLLLEQQKSINKTDYGYYGY